MPKLIFSIMPIGERMGNEPVYTVRIAGGVGNVMACPPSEGEPEGE